jgi:hypothetical protein
MGVPTPLAAVAQSLLPYVEDPQLANWLLRQVGDLDAPVRLQATLPAEQAKAFLRSRVHQAVSAARACDDPDALDIFARDSRVSVKRTVAASAQLRPDTVDRLVTFAIKNDDAEVFSGLLDKLPLEWFAAQLGPDLPADDPAAEAVETSSRVMLGLLIQCDLNAIERLFDRVVAAGDWQLFSKLAKAEQVSSYRRGVLRQAAAAQLGSTRRGHGGLDVADPNSPLAADRAALPLEKLLSRFRFWDEGRARWAAELVSRVEDGANVGFVVERHGDTLYRGRYASVSDPVAVDDAAADRLIALWRDTRTQLSDSRRIIIDVLRKQSLTHLASDPRQAHRYFETLAASDDPQVLLTLIWTLSGIKRLGPDRQERLVTPVADHRLTVSAAGIPDRFADRLPFDRQCELLRSGTLAITLGWLCGRRFAPVTAERLAQLVVDPGEAFESSSLYLQDSFEKDGTAALVKALPVAYISRVQQVEGVVGWLIDLAEHLAGEGPLDGKSQLDRDLRTLRATLSPELLVAVVDAAGQAGVRAAIRRPKWLHDRAVSLIGNDPEVWEGLLRLLPDWDQSVSDLIRTAALIAGVDITDKLEGAAPATPEQDTNRQLQLL